MANHQSIGIAIHDRDTVYVRAMATLSCRSDVELANHVLDVIRISDARAGFAFMST
jgi:hypothetical protein